MAIPVIAGVLAAAFLKADFFDKASQELIAVFGLMMAAVLPTMILTATVLRSGGLSVKRIAEYQTALVRQVRLWAGLFLIALLACTFVVAGKTIEWKLAIPLPESVGGTRNVAVLLNGFIVGLLVFLIIRARNVVDGIISLINLSAEIATGEAQARDEDMHREIEQSIANMQEREGFGRYVELKGGGKETKRRGGNKA